MVKLLKIKEEILKAAREKRNIFTGIKIRISAGYSSKQWNDIFKDIKKGRSIRLSQREEYQRVCGLFLKHHTPEIIN